MNALRIGLVGTGFIAEWHLKGFKNQPDASITGWCRDLHGSEAEKDVQRKGLQAQCRELGLTHYESFSEMVADPDIDAVIIGSINQMHYPQILEALNAGKHLLVEKPVVMEEKQVDEIKKISKDKDLVVFPGHNFAYRGAVRQAKEILLNGGIGEVTHASFVSTHAISEAHQRGWRARRSESGGGALMDSGHHLVYQVLYLLGMPALLQAFTSTLTLKSMECEDTALVNMRYANGTMCVVMQSWASNWGDGVNGIRIVGNAGNLIITDALYHSGTVIGRDTEYGNSFVNQASAFAEAILKGTKPLSTLDDARNTLKIVHSAYQSAKENSVVSL